MIAETFGGARPPESLRDHEAPPASRSPASAPQSFRDHEAPRAVSLIMKRLGPDAAGGACRGRLALIYREHGCRFPARPDAVGRDHAAGGTRRPAARACGTVLPRRRRAP